MRLLAVCLLAAVQLSAAAGDSATPSADPLKELEGHWEVSSSQASSAITFVLGDQLGLNRKGMKISVQGNRLLSGDRLIATLTTDFSATGIDVQKQVWIRRKP